MISKYANFNFTIARQRGGGRLPFPPNVDAGSQVAKKKKGQKKCGVRLESLDSDWAKYTGLLQLYFFRFGRWKKYICHSHRGGMYARPKP